MSSDNAIQSLAAQLEITFGVADRLAYSIARAKRLGLAPLNLEKLAELSDEEMEVLDAYIFRYGSLVSQIRASGFECVSGH